MTKDEFKLIATTAIDANRRQGPDNAALVRAWESDLAKLERGEKMSDFAEGILRRPFKYFAAGYEV